MNEPQKSETKSEARLSKHLSAAVNQLEKQTKWLFNQRVKKQQKIDKINVEIDALINSERSINEQIAKLKGD